MEERFDVRLIVQRYDEAVARLTQERGPGVTTS